MKKIISFILEWSTKNKMGIYLVVGENGLARNSIVAESLEDAENLTGYKCVDITDMEVKPGVGWKFEDGKWFDDLTDNVL